MKRMRRVEMRAVMAHQADPLDRPALSRGQILFGEPGKELHDLLRGVAMRQILDLWPVARRGGGDIVLDRHRQIDQPARHAVLLFNPANGCAPRTIAPAARLSKLPASR